MTRPYIRACMQCKHYAFVASECWHPANANTELRLHAKPDDCCEHYDRVGDMDEPTPERRRQWRGQ